MSVPTTPPTTTIAHGVRRPTERGQTTAEYALVLIAAATIALLAVSWASNSGAIGDLFDEMLERVTTMLP